MKGLLHKKRVLEKVALRMRNAGMCKAWASWFEKCYGAPTPKESAGKDGAADAKHVAVQRLGPMERAMATGEGDATFRRESRQQVANHAPCVGVSGAQRVSQGEQGNEKIWR